MQAKAAGKLLQVTNVATGGSGVVAIVVVGGGGGAVELVALRTHF